MLRIALAGLMLWLAASPAPALYDLGFPLQLIGRQIKVETRLKEDGSTLSRSAIQYNKTAYQGKELLWARSLGRGAYKGKSFKSELNEYYFLKGNKITIRSLRGITSREGKTWQSYSADFDWENKTAFFEFQDFEKDEIISQSVALNEGMIVVQDIGLYLQNMPERGVKEEKLTALLPNGRTFGMLLKLAEDAETVSVQGREVVCYRIELKPDLGLISYFIPNVNYWVEKDAPHYFVRYAGLLSGPGSPDVIQDMIY